MNDRGVGNSDPPGANRAAVSTDDTAAHRVCELPTESEVEVCEHRVNVRVDTLEAQWSVDCATEDTFLYAAITNISEMGIFVQTTEPLAVGTTVALRFAPPRRDGERDEPFVLGGVVQWVNRPRPRQDCPNPGMGVRFASLTLADRERIVEAIHTIAYLREDPDGPRN